MRPLFLALISLLLVVPAADELLAQERQIEMSSVPRDLADRLIGIANDPMTVRLSGEVAIPADSVIRADVVVMGSLHLAGRIDGEVIVVEGNAELAESAEVTGDLTVVSGEVTGDELAIVGGTLMAFGPTLRMLPEALSERVSTGERGLPNGIHGDFGRVGSSRFTVDPLGFNRLEGLSVEVGPAFSTGGRNPFRTDAVAILRTEGRAPFQTDRYGYRVNAEQFLGGRREVSFGGGVFSFIAPIESWGLSNSENDWSTFLFTSDHRDYVETRGTRAFVRATPLRLPIDLTVEYRDERSGVVAPSDPWSVFSSGRPWREQPLVAEGSLRSVVTELEIDTRDDRREPRTGWLIRGVWREGLGGTLALPSGVLPVPGPDDPDAPVGPELDADFSTAFLDLRRYNSIGSGATLALRGVLGGSPRAEVLPPQFQHTLGGPGTLPGYSAFAADCGARSGLVTLSRDDLERAMYPFYGCDRFALLQAEYRGSLGHFFGRGGPGRRATDRGSWWVVFFDWGRAWAEGDWVGLGRTDSPTLYDAGVGIRLGGLGIYWARPFGDDADGSKVTVRLGQRF